MSAILVAGWLVCGILGAVLIWINHYLIDRSEKLECPTVRACCSFALGSIAGPVLLIFALFFWLLDLLIKINIKGPAWWARPICDLWQNKRPELEP